MIPARQSRKRLAENEAVDPVTSSAARSTAQLEVDRQAAGVRDCGAEARLVSVLRTENGSGSSPARPSDILSSGELSVFVT